MQLDYNWFQLCEHFELNEYVFLKHFSRQKANKLFHFSAFLSLYADLLVSTKPYVLTKLIFYFKFE